MRPFGFARAFGAALIVSTLACAPRASERSRFDSVSELEGLAFVPAADFALEPAILPFADLSVPEPLVLDLFELTRGELHRLFREHAPGRRPLADTYDWKSEAGLRRDADDWPAFLSWREAKEVAGWRGMRLPTAREWLHVAVGRRGLRHPWGADQASLANTEELGVGVPTPVGTFENGRSRPFGCYDMAGNVWEWVADAVPGFHDTKQDLAETNGELRGTGIDGERRVSALGGAFDALGEPTYDTIPRQGYSSFFFHARRLDPDSLGPSVGVRMCAPAKEYLWTHAGSWSSADDAPERVRAVARRWAADPTARAGLIALLEELQARPGAPEELGWLREGASEEGP
ncbi:MAG TPA: hypothetical protein ENJ09_04515 [Planctomycetes bacterium]|nr:hypothetical protein [Planctomycetota bacterium]